MAQMNLLVVAGSLTHDPELRRTPDGDAVCALNLAIPHPRRRDGEATDVKNDVTFLKVHVWKTEAEWCAAKLKKGSHVLVEGRIKENRWEDRQTGQKRSRIECQASRIQDLDKKKGDDAPAAA